MKSRDLMFPALVFLGGAVIGRAIGVKPILKGAMTAANFAGYAPGDLFQKAADKLTHKVARKARSGRKITRATARRVRSKVAAVKAPVRRAAASKKPIQKKSKAI